MKVVASMGRQVEGLSLYQRGETGLLPLTKAEETVLNSFSKSEKCPENRLS